MTTREEPALAEWVSPGHPDRLADGIAEAIVTEALKLDPLALVGVEVAVHTNRVFIDGRVAASRRIPRIDLGALCRRVYGQAGYGDAWGPRPEELRVTRDLCLERLSQDERTIRDVADDQNVVLGYACDAPQTNYLPPAHWLAHRLGHALRDWREAQAPDRFGPDFKLLVQAQVEHRPGAELRLRWDRLTLSIQHADGLGYEEQHRLLLPAIQAALQEAETAGVAGAAASFEPERLVLNGAGAFVQGGPRGDNGLSGKKLVVDHYGPSVPIGGGALCGKDPHKIDRCGALRARQLAKRLCREGAGEAWVTLAWTPGESAPALRRVEQRPGRLPGGMRRDLPDAAWFAIPSIVRGLELEKVDWTQVLREGCFTAAEAAWER